MAAFCHPRGVYRCREHSPERARAECAGRAVWKPDVLEVLNPMNKFEAHPLPAETRKALLEILRSGSYERGRPENITLTHDGRRVYFLRSPPLGSVRRLHGVEVADGRDVVDLGAEDLPGADAGDISPEEKALRERLRLSGGGLTSYRLAPRSDWMVIPHQGRLYLWDGGMRDVRVLEGTGWFDPRISPDERWIAAHRRGELYLIDVHTGASRRLTSGASATLTHGIAEFVAQEEMNRTRGHWWAPDSRGVLYQQTDNSCVEVLYIASPRQPEMAPVPRRYPRAGRENARVRLGYIPVEGGETTWLDWDADAFPYLARVTWSPGAPPTTLVQSRDQRTVQLLVWNLETGTASVLLQEHDDAWINLDPSEGIPGWLEDGSAFLWSTERNGEWQLELRRADGALIRPLTPLGLRYRRLLHVDQRARVAFFLGGPDPWETFVYRVALDEGVPVKVTEGEGVHDASFASGSTSWVHCHWSPDGRFRARVHPAVGEAFDLAVKSAIPPEPPRARLLRVGHSRVVDASIVLPKAHREGQRYPVILQVYAGPGHREVLSVPRRNAWRNQWIADQGYAVVSIDGRGTPGHGRDWERVIKGNLIDVALKDQLAGLDALAEVEPALDMERVGVTGWSFGGYFAAMAAMRHPERFRCGVVGAPVVSWENYDTHYTERYMGLPDENPEGYRRADVLTYAEDLRRPLMIVHGLTDDNVFVMHALTLSEALFLHGIPHELILLNGTHILADTGEYLALWSRIMSFFDEHLRGGH